jgi:hypothetical protein
LQKFRQESKLNFCKFSYTSRMSESSVPVRPPITDSPWFWVYLYSTAGLIALALMQPKFGGRQAEIERHYQGRQRAAEKKLGQEPATPLSTSEDTIITLRPLYLILAGVCAVAWCILWWRHFRKRPITADAQTSGDAEPSQPENSS